jgi:hypothetical protein
LADFEQLRIAICAEYEYATGEKEAAYFHVVIPPRAMVGHDPAFLKAAAWWLRASMDDIEVRTRLDRVDIMMEMPHATKH